jgi:transcriptional antiterminator RfaH
VTDGREAYRLPASRWYALRCRSNFEARVCAALQAAGIGEFFPSYVETVRWSDRKKVTVRPLFPGYVFARFDRYVGSAAVLCVAGVISILGSNELSSVSDDEIANLKRVVESPVPVARGSYVAGARVRVERGCFAGVVGIVSRVKGETLLTIPIQILGRSVSVQIDAADVKAEKKAA